jgi:hypothetical protein
LPSDLTATRPTATNTTATGTSHAPQCARQARGRERVTGLDDRNSTLLVTAIRHAADQQ